MNDEFLLEKALQIVNYKIAELTKRYSIENDKTLFNKINDKIDILKKFRTEIYKGNKSIMVKIIENNKKGII